MTIELDTTLAQAEVLFLSFSQIVEDIDRRAAEDMQPSEEGMRNRKLARGALNSSDAVDAEGEVAVEAHSPGGDAAVVPKVVISENLRELLVSGRG